MFKFVKIVVALVILIVAGAFLYDRYRNNCCSEDSAEGC